MTTVRTISYEYSVVLSGEQPRGTCGQTTYAGVELDTEALQDPENLCRFLDQAAGLGYPPQAQRQPQQSANFFSPPAVNASLRQAVAAEAANVGRARSLSPALQQRQQQVADHNYLRRNYQPTWVDTIDEIYSGDVGDAEVIPPATRLACEYTRRPGWEQQQWVQQQQNWPQQQQHWEQKNTQKQQQAGGQCCPHCPQRGGILDFGDSQRTIRETASLSPQKSYHFAYQQQPQQQQQKEQQEYSINTAKETVGSNPQPASTQLLQYADTTVGNGSCAKCHNCGCQPEKQQQQIWTQQQQWQPPSQQKPQQHQQHSTIVSTESRTTVPKQYYYPQQQQYPPQQQQYPPQQIIAQQTKLQQIETNEIYRSEIVLQHEKPQQQQQLKPQQQQPAQQQQIRQQPQHGIGYYQMLKQQQTNKPQLFDSPIQKQQQQRQQQQQITQPQAQHAPVKQQHPTTQQTYYIEHRQEYVPPFQRQNERQQEQRHFVDEQPQQQIIQNQPQLQAQHKQEQQQIIYRQQQPSEEQQIHYQQQPVGREQIYYHQQQQQPQQHDYQQQEESQPQQQLPQREQFQHRQQQEQPTYRTINRPQYMHKPTNHLYFSPRGAGEAVGEVAGPPPTFTTAFGDQTRVTVSYRQLAGRSKSEDPRRHHSPVPGASERGYQYGGMDFIDHDGQPVFRPDDFEPADGSQTHVRKLREELPLRRPGDHYGLDFSTHPAAASLSPTRDDVESYQGYAPRAPRQHWKFSADPDAPLNNFEVPAWDQFDPTGLVGDTLSNQKVSSEPPLSEEEKNQFCLEFAPPGGFRPEHRTLIPPPSEPEPVCMSLSAKKDKLKGATTSTPTAQSQEQNSGNAVRANPLSSTQDSSWYSNGNKEVMRSEPNWSRNVVLRKQAWENEAFDKEERPSWVRSGRSQQRQQQPPLQHNEQQRMTRSAHWVKQQEREQEQQQQQRFAARQKASQNDEEVKEPAQQSQRPQKQQQQDYPKHPQQQYAQQWQLNQRDPQQQQQQPQPQRTVSGSTEQQQQPDDDNDVDVIIEEVEQEELVPQQQQQLQPTKQPYLQHSVQQRQQPTQQNSQQQIVYTQYQTTRPSGNSQYIVQESDYYPQDSGYKVIRTSTNSVSQNPQQQQQPQYYISKQQTVYQQPTTVKKTVTTTTTYTANGTVPGQQQLNVSSKPQQQQSQQTQPAGVRQQIVRNEFVS